MDDLQQFEQYANPLREALDRKWEAAFTNALIDAKIYLERRYPSTLTRLNSQILSGTARDLEISRRISSEAHSVLDKYVQNKAFLTDPDPFSELEARVVCLDIEIQLNETGANFFHVSRAYDVIKEVGRLYLAGVISNPGTHPLGYLPSAKDLDLRSEADTAGMTERSMLYSVSSFIASYSDQPAAVDQNAWQGAANAALSAIIDLERSLRISQTKYEPNSGWTDPWIIPGIVSVQEIRRENGEIIECEMTPLYPGSQPRSKQKVGLEYLGIREIARRYSEAIGTGMKDAVIIPLEDYFAEIKVARPNAPIATKDHRKAWRQLRLRLANWDAFDFKLLHVHLTPDNKSLIVPIKK